MKKILLTLTIGILLASCADKNAEKEVKKSADLNVAENKTKIELKYVDSWNQIELAHTDDKYGEWGGDTDIIKIYSDGKKYYADYAKYLGNVGPPEPPSENAEVKIWYEYKELESKTDSLELNNIELQLIKDAIIYLTKEKINNSSFPTHAGISNSVISRDSTLIIDSYPSDEWKPFQELKRRLSEK
ncbi:hypothetical protein ACFO5T_10845 [Dokdonia genika]|uniref:Lipoprotein n=1 Tax=Dokdonia genika TaxID=308113 RepID=A0ABV9L9W1_9FLAO